MRVTKDGKPLEIERKYLIKYPTAEQLSVPGDANITNITQTYLVIKEDGAKRRVRKRGNSEKGYRFTYTEKKNVSFGERIEIEREITEEEYASLLGEADPKRAAINKKRCCFSYDGQFFELDIYPFSDEYATLEIELDDINAEVRLPDFLDVIKDVTGDKRYENYALAERRTF